ncbi:ShlB/FhaC/HecB family hemolysin secretion/activation protein [Massilia sp. S19_KUP03_FR1]|uniref:ShlB/FhaC/HecB family hemolysin secretion/activation protein n=1 Tax=Massilia sp. S19_KUP03_FR1 TaxID=3025503 RepID=UPI002FCD8642
MMRRLACLLPLLVLTAYAAAQVPASPTFSLTAIAFAGNTVFSDATLQAQVADKLGQRVTFADLTALAARVTALYHDAGYILTDTVVPGQEIEGGKVTLSVLEGRLGRVRVERVTDVPVPEPLVVAILAQLQPGQPMTQQQLERALLMLSDTPGMATQAALEAGDAPGAFDLVVDLKAAPRTSFSLDLDNQGSPSTGKNRVGLLGRINSPFGRGDNLDLRLLSSFGKGLAFGRIAYELPLGRSGLRGIVAAGHIQYQLGQDFAALDAHGSADVLELGLSYPLIRSRRENLFGKATVEHKLLDDRLDAFDQVSRKRLDSLDLGLVYERRDDWQDGGYVSAGLDVIKGHLALRSEPDRLLDQGPGRGTAGGFVRATFQLARLQALGHGLSGYVALAGQWANSNLDSADKIAGGGPRAVRAYSSASGIGDEAAIVNAELRWAASASTTVSAFYDLGRVRLSHAPAPGVDNHLTLSGVGVGLYQGIAASMALRASAAWPTRHSGPAIDASGARLYAQIVKTF